MVLEYSKTVPALKPLAPPELPPDVLCQKAPKALPLPAPLLKPGAEQEAEVVGGPGLPSHQAVARQHRLAGAAETAGSLNRHSDQAAAAASRVGCNPWYCSTLVSLGLQHSDPGRQSLQCNPA